MGSVVCFSLELNRVVNAVELLCEYCELNCTEVPYPLFDPNRKGNHKKSHTGEIMGFIACFSLELNRVVNVVELLVKIVNSTAQRYLKKQ
ncbi:hypothetical protein L1887_38905 [Cichorium endivia]|nr:hypothetical protein L1887_38905 [Cichorium endivia]